MAITAAVTNISFPSDELFSEIQIPEQKQISLPEKDKQRRFLFPTVLAPPPTTLGLDLQRFVDSVKQQKPRIEALLRASGAVLLRGYPLATASDFDQVVEALGYDEFPSLGGAASRTRVVGRVFTANEAPPSKKIPLHHELAHLPECPSTAFFFCEIEPRSGGETPIIISNLVYEMVLNKYPDFCKKLEEHDVLYKWFLRAGDDYSRAVGHGWQSTFCTKDRSVAQERAEQKGMKLDWKENGVETTIGPRPAFRLDEGGRKTWHNSLFPNFLWRYEDANGNYMNDATFGDGTPVPSDVIEDCMRMAEEGCAAVPWKKGDVLLVDNRAVLHSRRPFEAPRRILASFGA